jgi:hypothetical protein
MSNLSKLQQKQRSTFENDTPTIVPAPIARKHNSVAYGGEAVRQQSREQSEQQQLNELD